MKALRQNGNAIIVCIIEVVVGILLLVDPVGLTTSIIIAAGIALMVDGLLNVIRYFKSDPEEAAVSQLLMRRDYTGEPDMYTGTGVGEDIELSP